MTDSSRRPIEGWKLVVSIISIIKGFCLFVAISILTIPTELEHFVVLLKLSEYLQLVKVDFRENFERNTCNKGACITSKVSACVRL